jgi:transcription initiation factor IIE alpha subunit
VAIKSGDKKTSKKYEAQKSVVIEYLTTKKSAKSEEFVEVLGVKISRVKIILKRMVEDGVIATDGGNRNRIYMLK